MQLFCLPFAGGSRYSYNGYAALAPEQIKVTAVEIPGRGSRVREKLLTDMHCIVEDVLAQIREELFAPYAVYGHSMGTLIGYLLIKKIISEGLPPPVHFFVTGRGGPSVRRNEPLYHLLPQREFVQQLNEMGGSPAELLGNESLMEFYEPIIRADFQSIETYQYCQDVPFDVPITCMFGEDEKVTHQEALAWQQETMVELEIRQFPGNHFFIFSHQEEIMQIVGRVLVNENSFEA